MKYILIVGLITLPAIAMGKLNVTADIALLHEEYFKKFAEAFKNSLNVLGNDSKILKINSVTSHIFSGTVDVINVHIQNGYGNVQNCDIQTLSHPWLPNDTKSTFNCSEVDEIAKAKKE